MSFEPLFIFSLPRAGSTLLQRMLACHPKITTVSEPWILLPLLALSRRECRILAEFSIESHRRALFDFLSKSPDGTVSYFSAVREFALTLYSKLASETTKYFLDKTPRYYLIIQEIHKCFPEAKCVFLFRHPLATLASMCEVLFNGNLMEAGHNIDAFKGPFLLIEGYSKFRDSSYTVHYERLVQNPHKVMKGLCEYLELKYVPSFLDNFGTTTLNGVMGDKKTKKYDEVVKEPLERWRGFFASRYRKRFAKRYLDYLGENIITTMGYDYNEIIKEIEAIVPTGGFLLKDMLGIIRSKIFSFLEFGVIRDRIRRSRMKWDSYPLQ